MESITLNKTFIGICDIASKDETRPSFQCVHIKDNYIEVINGFSAIRMNLLADEKVTTELLINAQVLKKLLQGLKSKNSLAVLEWNKEDERATFRNIDNFSTATIFKDNNSYPNIESVIPTDDKEYSFSVNAKLLKELLESIGKLDITTVNIEFHSNGKPFIITKCEKFNDNKDVEFKAILCPTKLD